MRHTPAHVIDLVPTVLELAGVSPPAEWNSQRRPALPGRSWVPLLRDDTPVTRDYLYWNHEDNRALRVGDLKIVSERESGEKWELYDLARDRIESHNLASEQPHRLKEMAELWMKLNKEFHAQGGAADENKPRARHRGS